MSAKFTTRQVGDVTVIDAVGRITLGEGASTFRDTIRCLVFQGKPPHYDWQIKGMVHGNPGVSVKILLNLGEVSYIDSSGFGELVSGFETVVNNGGQIKLVHLTKRVKDLLQITKMYTVFEVFDNEAHAVRSFA